jgi:hypothetical protein
VVTTIINPEIINYACYKFQNSYCDQLSGYIWKQFISFVIENMEKFVLCNLVSLTCTVSNKQCFLFVDVHAVSYESANICRGHCNSTTFNEEQLTY